MAVVLAEMAANLLEGPRLPGGRLLPWCPLVIREPMKMEIPEESPLDGTVREVRVGEGGVVQEGDELAVVERAWSGWGATTTRLSRAS